MKKKKKFIAAISIVILIVVTCFIYYQLERTILPLSFNPANSEVEVKISSGSSLRTIANLLFEHKVIQDIDDFIFTTKIFRAANKLKAGKYTLPINASNYTIVKILSKGVVAAERVVIPEGFTARQIASLLQKKIEIDSAKFMSLVNDREFIAKQGLDERSLEGYLYPNTYQFYWGMNEKDVIEKLVKEFHRNVTDSIRQKIEDMDWTLSEVVTLASIIEGEAIVDSERAVISAVYHNRLRSGMLLQADPTIQYIIPNGPRRLLKKDLAIESPYNTYKHAGLPPGPVNNPGIKSILAAIEPASVPYLYFVAKGDGSHIFSYNLRQHILAKKKFDAYRREVKRKAYAKTSNR